MSRLIFLTIFLFPSFVLAGTGSGKIVGYIPYSLGQKEVFFIKVETLSSTPECNTTARFVMKDDSPRYKMTQAAAFAAFISGASVKVKGTGTCSIKDNSEDMNYMCLGITPC